MAQPNPTSPDWLTPVIVGVFALLGVALGHLLTMLAAWLERKRRRSEMLLSKLDELTAANCATREWLQEIQDQAMTLSDLISMPPSISCCRLEGLTVLYFPRLQPPVQAYMKELKSYYSWALRSVRDDIQQPIGAQLHVVDKTRFLEQMNRIQNSQETLGSEIESESQALLNRS